MAQGNTDRAHIALQAMLQGKMLYSQGGDKWGFNDEQVLFMHPTQEKVYIALTFRLQGGIITTCWGETPLAQTVLKELGMDGKYSDYQEISLEHPDAQRVLMMYHAYCLIQQLRAECGKQLIDPQRLPPPDDNPGPGAEVPQVEFA